MQINLLILINLYLLIFLLLYLMELLYLMNLLNLMELLWYNLPILLFDIYRSFIDIVLL